MGWYNIKHHCNTLVVAINHRGFIKQNKHAAQDKADILVCHEMITQWLFRRNIQRQCHSWITWIADLDFLITQVLGDQSLGGVMALETIHILAYVHGYIIIIRYYTYPSSTYLLCIKPFRQLIYKVWPMNFSRHSRSIEFCFWSILYTSALLY